VKWERGEKGTFRASSRAAPYYAGRLGRRKKKRRRKCGRNNPAYKPIEKEGRGKTDGKSYSSTLMASGSPEKKEHYQSSTNPPKEEKR